MHNLVEGLENKVKEITSEVGQSTKKWKAEKTV